MISRACTCVAIAVVVASIVPGASYSQPVDRAGSGSGSGSGAAADDDDDAASATSSKLPVAPNDPQARDRWLADKLAAAITSRPKLGKTKLTFAIRDLATGKSLAGRDADHAMNLASNAKVLTSVAALGTLGGAFRWRTGAFATKLDDVAGTVDDLYIRGRGDPLLSVNDLRALASDIAARGVRSVEGKLVIDTSYFDDVV
ncbi:MAG: D-alanyl-D-alanine carboxypeptidase, partial [Proteobacteria bacterium]|nr:D-alanyl-D-alanine carboxypeptidase [Pseudomonadota bacterium]